MPLRRVDLPYGLMGARMPLTWDKAARIWRNVDIWRDPKSIVHRLPLHFKRRYWFELLRDRQPVHHTVPKHRFRLHERLNTYVEHEVYPVVPLYPPEADTGLWGGEGIIKGYRVSLPKKTNKTLHRLMCPRFWFPYLRRAYVYSEVLDRYMLVTLTVRTLRLIDSHAGLDFYLLRAADIDLASRLGRKLKREILCSLARRDSYEDAAKQLMIDKKYAAFRLPLEEAEWVALDLNDACRKQQDLEDAARPEPLKLQFERELLEDLRDTSLPDAEARPARFFGLSKLFGR